MKKGRQDRIAETLTYSIYYWFLLNDICKYKEFIVWGITFIYSYSLYFTATETL